MLNVDDIHKDGKDIHKKGKSTLGRYPIQVPNKEINVRLADGSLINSFVDFICILPPPP